MIDLVHCLTSRTCVLSGSLFFFFNDTATTEIYTLSLHDALPIFEVNFKDGKATGNMSMGGQTRPIDEHVARDRKSTRLNSSHQIISYAVFCLKKKKETATIRAVRRAPGRL